MRPLIIAGIGLGTIACGLGAAPPPPDLPSWKIGRDASGADVRVVVRPPYTYVYALDGRLLQLNFDSNRDGLSDVFAYFSSRKSADRVEIDADRDGKVDRIEYYDERGTLVRYSTPRKGASPEQTVTLDAVTGRPARVETDSNGDGRPERIEVFEGGELVRAEIDADSNGRADRSQEWKGGRLVHEDLDRDGDGRPDIRLVHDRSGAITRVEQLGGGRP